MALQLLSAVGTVVSVAIGVLAAAAVVFAVVWRFVQKKRGKAGCGCDCARCGLCSSCRPAGKGEEPPADGKDASRP